MTWISHPRVFVDDNGTGFAYVMDKDFTAVRGPDGQWDSPAPYISDQVLLAKYRLLDEAQARALATEARQAILKMIKPFRLPAKSITADFHHIPAVLTPSACWVKVEDRWIMNERAWGESTPLPRDVWLTRFQPLPPLPAAAFHQRRSAPFELPEGARPFLWRGHPCVLVCGICFVFNGEMWTIDDAHFSEWSELERMIWRNRFQHVPPLPKIAMMDVGREPFCLPKGARSFVDWNGLLLILPDQSCHDLQNGTWIKTEPTQHLAPSEIHAWCDRYETLPPFPRQHSVTKTVSNRHKLLQIVREAQREHAARSAKPPAEKPRAQERKQMLIASLVIFICWVIYVW